MLTLPLETEWSGVVNEDTRRQKYMLRPETESALPRRFLIDYQAELNASQYEAVITHTGPMPVLAGAGSGKTRTLVFRVARMVE